jgi:MerR family redox-sensitive transcriptional activator SoxR
MGTHIVAHGYPPLRAAGSPAAARAAPCRCAGPRRLSLDAIKAELAKLPGGRPPTRADWNRISKTWQSTIDARIEELQRLRGSLTECIGCGCLSLDKCHLTNASDRIARNGPGARFWIGDRRF